jgi:hypothetical protein
VHAAIGIDFFSGRAFDTAPTELPIHVSSCRDCGPSRCANAHGDAAMEKHSAQTLSPGMLVLFV